MKQLLGKRSHYKDWKPTDAVEIKKIIGLLFKYGNC